MKLKGRTALVTGGSRGIGRAIALALAAEGADVAINYVSSEPAAKEVAEQIRKIGRHSTLAQADVGDYPDTFRMAQDVLKEFGHLDILVNNAAEQHIVEKITDLTAQQLERTFRTNIFGYFFMAKAAIPHMKPGAAIESQSNTS